MKKAINTLVLANLAFLLLHAISGMLEGPLSEALYLLAFILPVALALIICGERAELSLLRIKRSDILLTLPVVPITVITVIGISALTTLIMGAFGIENEVVLEGGFFEAALRYALLTAVLEELIFRYLPMRLLAHRSPRAALLLSSLFFSLVHCDLFQMPYALFAGAVFMILDLAANSVIPSLVIHFLNNLLAVAFHFYADSEAVLISMIASVSLLAIVGVGVVALRRRRYIGLFRAVSSRGDFSLADASAALCLAIPTLTVAIMSL